MVSRLSRSVARAGKGAVIRPSTMKTKVVQPTTLDMGAFGSRLKRVPAEDRAIHRNTLAKVETFRALRIPPLIRDNMRTALFGGRDMGPTPIQKVAIKALRKPRKEDLSLRSWLLAAETGSGKTVAYLAPLLSDILEEKAPSGPHIRGIIMVPTAELIAQVLHVVRSLSPEVKASSTPEKCTKGIDVLVTTPAALNPFTGTTLGERALPHVRTVIVDEADTLLDASFRPDTFSVIKSCPQIMDLVFCTATIPVSFDKVLRKDYPTLTRLVTPSIHRLPRHIDFRVIEVFLPPYRDNKPLALLQALYAIWHDNTEPGTMKRVVVFVNKKSDVEPLVNRLCGEGYMAEGIEGSRSPAERQRALDAFIHTPPGSSERMMKVLVATDLAARGIDMQRVRNVILYDLPRSAADLLHRAGRTGRLGSKGRVIMLISKKESAGWVRGLQTVVRKGHALA